MTLDSINILTPSTQLLNLPLDILPHMTMEFESELAEGTGQSGPFYHLGYRIIGLAATDRTRE